MLELDFDGIQIQEDSREIWVHPVGHSNRDWDYRAGVLLSWQDGGVVLQTIRFFNDCGAYVHATVAKFPDRPFPKSKAEAIGITKNILSQFAAALATAFPATIPCQACNGSGADLHQGEGSCKAQAEIARLGKLALDLLREGEGGGAYFSPDLARAAYLAAGETLPEYLMTVEGPDPRGRQG